MNLRRLINTLIGHLDRRYSIGLTVYTSDPFYSSPLRLKLALLSSSIIPIPVIKKALLLAGKRANCGYDVG